MYLPNYTKVEDLNIIKQLVEEYSFGTIITKSNNLHLNANHYPFLITENEDKNNQLNFTLWAHLSKKNPQLEELNKSSALVIFTGPSKYISPSYYKEKLTNVPTWSYAAVHLQCDSEVIECQSKQKELMEQMVHFYENPINSDWDYGELPEDFKDNLLNEIAWVKLKIITIEAKFKLSQNRTQSDYSSLVEILKCNSNPLDHQLLKYMNMTATPPFKS